MVLCSLQRCSPGWLRAGDIVLALFIFFPAQVLFWRGVWDLLDLYLLAGDMCTGSWISLAIGIVLRCFYSAIQLPLNKYLNPKTRGTARMIFVIVHNFVFALIVINHWRGLWTLLDCYTGFGGLSNGVSLIVSLFIMWGLRCSNTALSAPFYVVLDHREDLLVSAARFRTPPAKVLLHFLDQLFSLLFCYGSAIAFWRAMWNLQDVYLLPDRYIASNVISLGTGFVLFGILLIVEYPVVRLAAQLDEKFWRKLVLEDMMILFGSIGIISAWRGLWNLAIVYIIPQQPLGGAVSMVIGGVPMWLSRSASSLYDFTICLDGGYTEGEGCAWDIRYLQLLAGEDDKSEHGDPEEKETINLEKGHVTKNDGPIPASDEPLNNGWATPYDPTDLNCDRKITMPITCEYISSLGTVSSTELHAFPAKESVV